MIDVSAYISFSTINLGCDPLDVTNASKHSIDQSEDRILQINQSKNASNYSPSGPQP